MRFRRDSEIIWTIVLSPFLAIVWLWYWWRERKTENEE
jgi:cbb3-type cytochrome oxidase subunit 3